MEVGVLSNTGRGFSNDAHILYFKIHEVLKYK